MKKWLKYRAARLIDGIVTLLPFSAPHHLYEQRCSPTVPSNGKFLFIVLDQLGDAVMATAAIIAMKSFFPQSILTILTRPVNRAVFAHNPHVDKIITDEAPWWSDNPFLRCCNPLYWISLIKNIHLLRNNRYDAVIDLRGDLRHILLFGALVKPRILLSYAKTGGRSLLRSNIEYNPNIHEIDKKLLLLEPLGCRNERPHPHIWLLSAEINMARQIVKSLLGDSSSYIVLIDPGAKAVQRWPTERFIRLIERLSGRLREPVLISAGPLYKELANDVVNAVGTEIARSIVDVNIRELAAIISICDLVVSSDTGIAHIASAVGTKTVVLYGPTDPNRFWHGIHGSQIVKSDISCCTSELHEKCLVQGYKTHGACMDAISIEMVEKAIYQAIDIN